MSILWVREQFLERDGSGDEKAEREYTRIWKIGVDDLLIDSRTILAAPGLPHLFNLYVGADGSVDELGATCRKLSARHIEDFVWEVTAKYSNKTQQAEKGNPNPLLRPIDISADGVTFQTPLDFTPTGKAICSSVGGRFDPAVTRDDSRRTFLFVRNEAAPQALADLYRDVVNSDAWNGNPPGTAKVGVIKEQRADENNFYYWKVSYPISVDLDGWDALVIDEDTHWLDFRTNAVGDQKGFFDAHGNPLSGAKPLNGEGGPLYPQGFNADLAPGACSTLSGSVLGGGSTTIPVASVAGFPAKAATYPITLLVESELMQATALTGTTFTVVRGYGGSTAVGHASGVVVQMQPYYLTFQRYRRLPFAALALG